MLRPLNKKLFRDILHLRGQIIATALVVACGVASYVSMQSTYESLLTTQQEYYSEYRFGDIFAHATRVPESVKPVIERIPGVSAVQSRVVADVILDIPGLREPAQGRVISIPDTRVPILNDLHLKDGRYLNRGQPDEVIISSSFAEANEYTPGAHIAAIINGRWRRLTIVGIAMSPEYIYEIRGGDIFPDNKRFGILWMNRSALGSAFDMDGAFNDLSAILAPGASEPQVVQEIDRILSDYGGAGAFGRSDQQSFRFISNEFAQLRTFGMFLPVVFLGVTAFLIHLVLSRLVNTQREQIGLLKAFGYDNLQIGLHFLSLALVAVVGGLVVGIFLGAWMGSGMTRMYADYFRFPVLSFDIGWSVMIYSALITFGAASVGALAAVWKAVQLPPAEAMRPEAPKSFASGILERSGLSRYLPSASRIVLRNVSRHPLKSLLSTFGISLSAALLFTGFYFFDAIDRIIEVQFDQAVREDAVVTFSSPRAQKARAELVAIKGITDVETFRGVPVRMLAGHRSKRLGLTGLETGTSLHRLVDKDSRVFNIPATGLVVSKALADHLRVSVGDTITVEVLEGKRPTKDIVVGAIIDELMGMNAYMNIRALNRFLDEDDLISGAYLATDSRYEDEIYTRLKTIPGVAGVGLPGAMLESFRETFAQTIGIFTTVLVLFAGAIVFGVVYNAARIALSERGRELASLRVLGFTKGEIAKILLGEQAVLILLAIPLGFLVGMVLCSAMNNLVDTELMRLPLVFTERTFVLTGVFVLLAAVISGSLVIWRLHGLDLIAVLKTRE